MRALGPSVIVLALAFSAGGVAYRTQAGPQATPDKSATAGGQAHDSQQCEVTEPASAQAYVIDLSKLPGDAADGVRPLSRTGYNYREPGLWHPEAPPPPSKAAPAAPIKD